MITIILMTAAVVKDLFINKCFFFVIISNSYCVVMNTENCSGKELDSV